MVLVIEGIRHGDTFLWILEEQRFSFTLCIFLPIWSLWNWHSEAVSDDVRFLCIKPRRPVANGVVFLKLIYLFYSVTIVCIFSPSLHPTPASPTSFPHLYPPPWFCPCVLYSSSYRPVSPLSPPHSPLAIVTMFLISMSLIIFCLLFSFVDYVEHWVLNF